MPACWPMHRNCPCHYSVSLRVHRRRLGLSPEELAARLGVSLSTYQRWERGEFAPHPRRWPELAAACGVSVGVLGVWFPPVDVVPSPEPAFLEGVGRCVWRRRRMCRLSASVVAGRVGMSVRLYMAVESGRRELAWADLVELAAVFRCEVLELLPPEPGTRPAGGSA